MQTLYFMIGAPGVGKSTFIKKVSEDIFGNKDYLNNFVVSPDNIRGMVQSPSALPNGRFEVTVNNDGYVWKIVNDIIARKVNRGELIIVDATHSRNTAISAYKKYSDMGYRIVAIDFSKELTLDEVLAQNEKRKEDFGGYVPPEGVKNVYQRCLDLDIPGWVEKIKPDEFVKHFKNIKYDYNDYNRLSFYGDIHGCSEELKRLLDASDPGDEKQMNVFIGDYFDRGYGIVETFNILQEFSKNNDTIFLKGNHEEPLAHYKDFMKAVTEDIHAWIQELEKTFAQKEQLLKRSKELQEEINKDKLRFLKRLPGFGWIIPKEKMTSEQYLEFIKERLNDPKLNLSPIKESSYAWTLLKQFKGNSYKQLDKLIMDMMIQTEDEFAALTQVINEFKLPAHLEKNQEYNFNHIKRSVVYTMKTFLLSPITYQEISQFYKGLHQMFNADFNGTHVVATHGGLTHLPTMATPTSDMIRGVGGYDDTLECDETFERNVNERFVDALSIHGHRNMTNLPIVTTERTFNLNGDVDLGMRGVILHKDTIELTEIGPGDKAKEHYKAFQLKRAKKHGAKKLTTQEQGDGLISLFQNHDYVDVKKLPNNIAAINFTRKAFEKGKWDAVTIKARGLFVGVDTHDNPSGPNQINIIARGYEKFFNLGERHGLQTRDIRELAYPIRVYEKANGYLGIMSIDTRDPENPKWFTASKSTSEGDFADHFREMVNDYQTPELMEMMIKDNTTLVFEVVDPVWDPHIEEYRTPELVLLDAVINELVFKRIGYEMLDEYMDLMNPNASVPMRKKELVKVCDTFNDWNILVQETKDIDNFSKEGIEGFVFEDSSEVPVMFKLKTDWYSFWKAMRSRYNKIKVRLKGNLKKKGGEGSDGTLTKSQVIHLKKDLWTQDMMLVWNYMRSQGEEDFERFNKMSMIDIRNGFLETPEAKEALSQREK